jgi:hypothetical protein
MLHFELCFYRLIEYAIANGLRTFEGGAGGEHKLKRGFLPRRTHSAHWIRHPGLARAVVDYIDLEAQQVAAEVRAGLASSPFAHSRRQPKGPASQDLRIGGKDPVVDRGDDVS